MKPFLAVAIGPNATFAFDRQEHDDKASAILGATNIAREESMQSYQHDVTVRGYVVDRTDDNAMTAVVWCCNGECEGAEVRDGRERSDG